MKDDPFKKLLASIDSIESILGYTFADKMLLVEACTHRSFVNEYKKQLLNHNERLEFLGDTVLNLIVSKYLFMKYPETNEGVLSNIKSQIVSKSACYTLIEPLDIGKYLLIGKGEKIQLARSLASLQANLLEAILGAVFIDSDFATVESLFLRLFSFSLEKMIEEPEQNYKSLLQEHWQRKAQLIPSYAIINASGPEHERVFEVAVSIDSITVATATGSSKKEAEQKAAKKALEQSEVL